VATIASAPADAQHRVTALQQAARDRVEDLVEDGVADALAPGELDQRQRERLAAGDQHEHFAVHLRRSA
jgi:hypothetical protein